MTEKLTIELPNTQSAMSLAGNQEENLKIISKQTGANLVMRGLCKMSSRGFVLLGHTAAA